ncbi:hypothetical protein GYMLUDRAFT_97284 [Collybiopsis luxurians FD-317 M1]|uniref:Guanine nucleotide-binding protein subunit alpha n=1 Tax=Collybiopsis luxurians FD-317 M1 TaxID=944289 RepID=A0A0D0CNB7_9AGAR|nr:hypothetical protein GYMLUDRAFT_97284 [Collybiopsis luxurians FD-317 M1]
MYLTCYWGTYSIILNILHRAELNVDQRNRVHLATLLSLPPQIEDILLSQNIIHAVSCLWKDPVVKEAIRSPRELPIDRTSIYFMDSLDQFSWKVDELTYKFLLIGTQQLERRKWVQIFENVTAFMFLVNISEYDQVLHEDGSVNRTQEALNVFGHICNSQWFPKTPIILFMNEADVLMEKLPRAPLRDYFPDYTGKDNYDAAREYLLHRFISLNEGPVIKQIYPFYVSESGDDIMFLQYLLNTVQDILLDSHLRECGLV